MLKLRRRVVLNKRRFWAAALLVLAGFHVPAIIYLIACRQPHQLAAARWDRYVGLPLQAYWAKCFSFTVLAAVIMVFDPVDPKLRKVWLGQAFATGAIALLYLVFMLIFPRH